MEYTISKNGQQLTSGKDYNICEALKSRSNDVGAYAKALGLPAGLNCPFSKVSTAALMIIFVSETI